jgi:hypothetical protein
LILIAICPTIPEISELAVIYEREVGDGNFNMRSGHEPLSSPFQKYLQHKRLQIV